MITTALASLSSSESIMAIKPFRGGSSRVSYPQQQQHHQSAMMDMAQGSSLQTTTNNGMTTNTNLMTKVATNIVQFYNNNKSLKKRSDWSSKDRFVYLLVVLSLLTSVAAMLFDSGLLIDMVALSSMGFSITTLALQRKLTTEYESVRKQSNIENEEALMLQAIKDKSTGGGQIIEKKSNQLQSIETALENMGGGGTTATVNELVCQVKEYKEMQQSLKESMKDQIRQTLANVVVNNQNYWIGPTAMELLCLRFKAAASQQYYRFDENAFRAAMKKNGGSIMEFSKQHLADDDVMRKEKIFVL